MTVFDRIDEIEALRRRLGERISVLLHGPAGAGKTLLLEHVLPEFPHLLYCPQSSSPQAVFRAIARALARKKDAAMLHALGSRPAGTITAVSLKGIVTKVLRGSGYMIVLDHLNRPSHSMAAVVRELMISCSIPVIAVARSAHMEDAGFVGPLFPDRGDKFAIKNFDPKTARSFVRVVAEEHKLAAENFDELAARIVELSGGNPGAIVRMVKMARMSKYRLGEHVKLAPLYIDFRLQSVKPEPR
ncbi:MAG: AAA family ATPase [Candidatus Korobacteraceae bacterium]|jgi:hypothetical protein